MNRAAFIVAALWFSSSVVHAETHEEANDPCARPAATRPWFCCEPGDSLCDVKTKSEGSQPNPDGPVALSIGYGVRFGPALDPRLAVPDNVPQLSLAVEWDPSVLSTWTTAVTFELEYDLLGASTPNLFGGVATSAATVHSIVGVVGWRWTPPLADKRWLAMGVRAGGAVGWGALEMRDAESHTDHKRVAGSGFVRLSGYLTLRLPGLTFEAGWAEWFDELWLEQKPSHENIALDPSGLYARLSLTIRFP